MRAPLAASMMNRLSQDLLPLTAGPARAPDEAAEHLLGILYVVHRDGIDAQRAFYPKADLPPYRADGRCVLKGTRSAKT
jgi:hypothetical protein